MKRFIASALVPVLGMLLCEAAYANNTAAPTEQVVSTYFLEETNFYMWKVHKVVPPEGQPQCRQTFSHILQKGSMDIAYVVGYLDSAGGKGPRYGADGKDYGVARTQDRAIYMALLERLKAPCVKPNQKFCGFQIKEEQIGYTQLTRNIEFFGQPLKVNFTLAYSSVSEVDEVNKSTLRAQQQILSQQSETIFLNAIRKADIAFYNGHSRDGGGPDFYPPILLSNSKTNYALYQKNRTQIKKVLESLRARQDNNLILGLFSCSSNPHFSKSLLQVNPRQKMILSGDTIYTNEGTDGSVGYLEALMRGVCGEQLSEVARQSDRTKYGFSDYNIK